jgi:thioredoxin reductase
VTGLDAAQFVRQRQGPASLVAVPARGISVVCGGVASLEILEDRLVGVRLSDGTVVSRQALAVSPRMVARAGFLAPLGLRPAQHPSGAGEYIPSDATGRTEAPGVWVAANVTDPAAQVGTAAAAGVASAAQINADLAAEETRRAVAAYRDPLSAASEARVCELVMGERRHGQ